MSAHSHAAPSAAPQSQPSPQLFFETINAFQRSAALKGAIDLDLFTAIAEGKKTAESIALRCQASQRGVRILADYLTVIGFLTKSGQEYELTPDTAAFLNRHSPAYMGGAVGFLLYPEHVKRYDSVADAVRQGGTAFEDDTISTPDHEMWVTFAESMGKLQMLTSELLANVLHVESAQRLKVLDIAAGHGMFGVAIAKRNPHAEVVAQDWQNVLDVAKKNAELAGVAGRWKTLPGSAFEVDFGKDYDLVLVTNFIHHFDKPTTEALLKKIQASLTANGRIAILDFIPNEDRVTPPMPAMFPLTMLVGTKGGDAYTHAEYQQMLKKAGFNKEELHDLPPSFFRVIVAKK